MLKPLILHGINSIIYVETIKEARLDGSKYTYAEAFNRHFRGDWEYFINNYGDEIVEYSGRDTDGNTFVVRWSITPLDKKQFQYNMIHCSYAGISLLDGGLLGYGAAAIGLYAIMNY